MRELVVMGELLTMFSAQTRGSCLRDVRGFSRTMGGAAAQTAAAAARLGVPCRVIAGLGADAFGDYLVLSLAEYGVYTKEITRFAAPTAKCYTAFPADAPAARFYDRAASADLLLSPRHVHAESFARAGALCFDLGGMRSELSQKAQAVAVQYACTQNAVICMDTALPPELAEDARMQQLRRTFAAQSHLLICDETSLPFDTAELSGIQQRMRGRMKLLLILRRGGGLMLLTKRHAVERTQGIASDISGMRQAMIGALLFCLLQANADPRMLVSASEERLRQWLMFAALYAGASRGQGIAAEYPTKWQFHRILRRGQ